MAPARRAEPDGPIHVHPLEVLEEGLAVAGIRAARPGDVAGDEADCDAVNQPRSGVIAIAWGVSPRYPARDNPAAPEGRHWRGAEHDMIGEAARSRGPWFVLVVSPLRG